MHIYGTFYGYEQRTNVSRLFKIYATDQGIYGGWIADRDYEEMLARFAGHGVGQHNVAITQQAAESAVKWERLYDSLELDSSEFLNANKENFHFLPNQVSSALTWKLKVLERAATRFGALDLTAGDGKKRRFYLVGRRTADEVAAILQNSLPATDVDGTPPASSAFSPLNNTTKSTGATPDEGPVHKSPNWPMILSIYAAAWVVALVLAFQFNFWWGLMPCIIAPYVYRMLRFGGILTNYHKNTTEQLKRDRQTEDALR